MKKKLLLLSTSNWIHPCRFPKLAAEAGFEVAGCMPRGDRLASSAYLAQTHAELDLAGPIESHVLPAFLNACVAFQPDLIVPVDEVAIEFLTMLHPHAEGHLRELLEASKGDPAHHQTVRSKHRSTALARELGIRTPAERPLPDLAALDGLDFPLVIKEDTGCGGNGVHLCPDLETARAALAKLFASQPHARPVAQRYVSGMPASCAGVAHQGRLVASFVARKLEQFPAVTGPCSVARVGSHAEIQEAARRYVEATGMSGFFDLDFLLDDQDRSWFLECNARATPVTGISPLAGVDLFAALHAALTDAPFTPSPREATIALFPKELMRDRRSPYLQEAVHDVPWDEPEVFQTMMRGYPWKDGVQ